MSEKSFYTKTLEVIFNDNSELANGYFNELIMLDCEFANEYENYQEAYEEAAYPGEATMDVFKRRFDLFERWDKITNKLMAYMLSDKLTPA